MTLDEWKALGIFALGVYALSFFSEQAAIFLLLTVGIAAFVTRYTQAHGTPATGAPATTGGAGGPKG